MNPQLNIFTTIVCLLHIATRATPAIKIWKRGWDIRDPKNWLSRKYGSDCNGLVLGEECTFVLGDMKVQGLSIDFNTSEINLMDGATIDFNEDLTDVLNTIHLAEFSLSIFSWMDPSNWITKGEEGNVAVPHTERIPCVYDELEFPKGGLSGPCLIKTNVKIRSMKFGDAYLTNDDMRKLKVSTIPTLLGLYGSMIEITGKNCTDSDECLCNSNPQEMNVCPFVIVSTDLDVSSHTPNVCSNPLIPIGHCTTICGAVITAKPQHNFNIEFLKHSLKGYTSHTYASKMKNGTEVVVQIVFAEQTFTGISLDEAEAFYFRLIREDIFHVKDVRIWSSEELFSQTEMTKTILPIVFGTVCGVALLFAILFFIFSPRFSTLRNRINFFAKRDASDQTGLIPTTESPAESVVSLDKSIDPIYGISTPSTAGTSYDTVAALEERVVKSEISLESPMYDLNSRGETSGDNKEEELVDLIKKEEGIK